MNFVEVAVQNVRGFSAQGRFPLKPGYLVLKPPASETSPFAGLALALLYSDGRGGDTGFVASGQKGGKAAFTFVGQDNLTYRLLRDLGGQGTLHKQTVPGQPPELVSDETAEISQYLRSQAGLPSRTMFEQVYCLMPNQLPSRRPRPRTSRPDVKRPSLSSGSGLASNQAVQPAEDIPAAEARVRELEQEIIRSRDVDELQFKLDGLNSTLFEVERKLNSTEGLKVAIRDAENAWSAAPTPESLGLPADILTRVERYPKALSRRDDALNRLNAEREQEAQAVPVAVQPLKRNPLFWVGLGAGALFLLAGIILSVVLENVAWRYLVLLDIPAFGWAAMLAVRYVDDLSQTTTVRSKEGMFAAREKKILEEFEAETLPVRKAIKALELESHEELPAVFERKALLEQKVHELRDQLTAMESAPDFLAAGEQRESTKREIEELNAQIGKIGTYVRDVREVEREMARTKESIALAKAPPSPSAGPVGGPAEPLEDPSPLLMAQAADIFSVDISTVAGQLRERCNQYLTALTDRRYQGVDWDRDGRGYVIAAGRQVPVGEIIPRDLDMYYLALRMTVVEKASAKVKYPFLLEHPFAGMDEVKLPLVGRMLKHLGTLTQVLHVTAHPGFAQLADGTVNI
ncbi:ATP-binding protein [Hyalangium rubrum]|uniref:Chromosome segregation protein SMC n=1 Tax=Hyalangium rubrum TaxID=3103134 RepID=A0ABU5HDQ7_9BACT|nr:chromosome segregation protein SMC [Hyalangium sp. s54d21]MDY7231588.1 chromosome segregation protein SMC [Hyalangium sp. s54d21]